MTCDHLRKLELAIIGAGIRETFRGPAWSNDCREWVYFDCFIDVEAVQVKFRLPECVLPHVYQGTHGGEERGVVCRVCHDAIIGYVAPRPGHRVFNG